MITKQLWNLNMKLQKVLMPRRLTQSVVPLWSQIRISFLFSPFLFCISNSIHCRHLLQPAQHDIRQMRGTSVTECGILIFILPCRSVFTVPGLEDSPWIRHSGNERNTGSPWSKTLLFYLRNNKDWRFQDNYLCLCML